MNAEREIIKRLWESRDCDNEELDEKTYTVGDTQYWKRNGKTYKWTESGGRVECSEDEYMKAISGGNSKSTEPKNDKAKGSKEIDNSVRSMEDYVGDEEVKNLINDSLRHNLGDGESYATVNNFKIISEPDINGRAEVEFEYSVDVRVPIGKDPETGNMEYESDTEYRTGTYNLKIAKSVPDKYETNKGYKPTAKSISSDWELLKDITGEYPDKTSVGQQVSMKSKEDVVKAHRDIVKAIEDRGAKVVSEKSYNYDGNIANMQGGNFKVTTFEDSEGNQFEVRSRTGGKEKQIIQVHNTVEPLGDSWKEVSKLKKVNISNPEIVDDISRRYGIDSSDIEEVFVGDHGYEYFYKGDETKSLGFYNDRNGTLTKGIDKSQLKSKPERDPSESDHINYDGVSDFDHTTWYIDGFDTQISRNVDSEGNPLPGYYVQNEDWDMEFDTKADLVKYLRDNEADFQGYDSEKDY